MATITIDVGDDKFGNAKVLQGLKPGEPFFVVRAQDKLGARTVRFWASEACKAEVNQPKVTNALRCADAMLGWPNRKMPD